MLDVIRVCALRAVEDVFVSALLGFGVRGVGVWVGDFGRAAVYARVDAVPGCDYCGEGGDAEDVAVDGKGWLGSCLAIGDGV